jgi:hypothetical protein
MQTQQLSVFGREHFWLSQDYWEFEMIDCSVLRSRCIVTTIGTACRGGRDTSGGTTSQQAVYGHQSIDLWQGIKQRTVLDSLLTASFSAAA